MMINSTPEQSGHSTCKMMEPNNFHQIQFKFLHLSFQNVLTSFFQFNQAAPRIKELMCVYIQYFIEIGQDPICGFSLVACTNFNLRIGNHLVRP